MGCEVLLRNPDRYAFFWGHGELRSKRDQRKAARKAKLLPKRARKKALAWRSASHDMSRIGVRDGL